MKNETELRKRIEGRFVYWKVEKAARDNIFNTYAKCAYCGIPIRIENFSIDHINNPKDETEYEKKGKENNVVLCCRQCNRSKGNKTVSKWLNSDSEYFSSKKEKIIAHMLTVSRFTNDPKIGPLLKK